MKNAIMMGVLFAVLLGLVGCDVRDDATAQELFEEKLKKFSERRYALAQEISRELDLPIPEDVHPFFEAAMAGDGKTVIRQGKVLVEPFTEVLDNELFAQTHEVLGIYEQWDEWEKDAELLN